MCPSSRRRSGCWPFFFFWPCCLSPSPGRSVSFGGLFYLWWQLPPRLVSLGGPLLGPPVISSVLHGVGVMHRAIPSPGPLWRSLQFSALAPPLAEVLPFLRQELSLDVVISFHPVLRALLRSFRVSSPSRAVRPPSWALTGFLRQRPSLSFASLRSTPLRSLVKMVFFFVALATPSLLTSFRCSPVVPSLAPSWLYLCPTLRLVSTYVLCFAQFMHSAFSWTGRLPCSVAPAVFLSLRAARLGLFLWPRFRSSSR